MLTAIIILSMILTMVLGFFLATLLDRKVRGEDVFRTIFLYPFALSFIVTGLAWQWILNPEFRSQRLHPEDAADVRRLARIP